MQVIELERNELVRVLELELAKLGTQQPYSDKFWNLLCLISMLKDLYRKDSKYE